MNRTRPGWIVLATAVPTFLVSMNNLVVTNALPQIGRVLSANLDEMQRRRADVQGLNHAHPRPTAGARFLSGPGEETGESAHQSTGRTPLRRRGDRAKGTGEPPGFLLIATQQVEANEY